MGSPPNDIPVQMYSFEKDTNEVFATVTEDCVPIEAHFSSGKLNRVFPFYLCWLNIYLAYMFDKEDKMLQNRLIIKKSFLKR